MNQHFENGRKRALNAINAKVGNGGPGSGRKGHTTSEKAPLKGASRSTLERALAAEEKHGESLRKTQISESEQRYEKKKAAEAEKKKTDAWKKLRAAKMKRNMKE